MILDAIEQILTILATFVVIFLGGAAVIDQLHSIRRGWRGWRAQRILNKSAKVVGTLPYRVDPLDEDAVERVLRSS